MSSASPPVTSGAPAAEADRGDGDLAIGLTPSGPAPSRAAPGPERAGGRDDDLAAGLRPAGPTLHDAMTAAMGEALARALREADRLEELPEAAEALARDGLDGLERDQGRGVRLRFADLLRTKGTAGR